MYYYIAFEVKLDIEKLKSYKSPGINQVPAELIKARSQTVHYEIHKLITSIWNEELPEEWKDSIIVPIYKKSDITDGSKCQLCTKFHPTSCCQG